MLNVPAFFVNGEQDCGLFSTQCYTVSNYLISNGFAKGHVLASKRWPFGSQNMAYYITHVAVAGGLKDENDGYFVIFYAMAATFRLFIASYIQKRKIKKL